MKKIILILSILFMSSASARTKVCDLPISQLVNTTLSSPNFDEGIPTLLLNIKSFIGLKICAPTRWQEYASYIQSSSIQEAIIIIYASQSLKGNSYFEFGTKLLKGVKENRVASSLYSQFLFPGYDWNTEFVENYNDPRVVKLLEASKLVLNNRKNDINDILTGRALDALIDSRLNQRAPITTL